MNYLHIGYPKAASTFLRDRYFIPENGFINVGHDATHEWRMFIQHRLLAQQSSVYDAELPFTNFDKSMDVGLSSSDCIGSSPVDFSIVLKRWRSIYPDSRVLIVTRAQHELLYSWYGQLVRAGYSDGPDEFLRSNIWNSQQNLWGRLCFDRIFEMACSEFEHVKVIPYELTRTFEQFVLELNSFFGKTLHLDNVIVVRRSPPGSEIIAMRHLNRIFHHGLGLPSESRKPGYVVGYGRNVVNRIDFPELPNSRRKLIRTWSHRLGAIFAKRTSFRNAFYRRALPICSEQFGASNHRLQEIVGIDLSELGYPGMDPNVSADAYIPES